MRPICAKCRVFFRCKENEVIIEEGGSGPDDPYRVWMADLFECPRCGAEVVSGFGQAPVAHYRQPEFTTIRAALTRLFYADDC